ncbi:WG repeat-containing protein [Paenibacillus rigui]|nr:WG repeat-containing protein [Paenibacillus rigui]
MLSKSSGIRLLLCAALGCLAVLPAPVYTAEAALSAATKNPTFQVTVLEPTELFEDYRHPDASVGTVSALQTLTVKGTDSGSAEQKPSWYLVETWLGDRWIHSDDRVVKGAYERKEQTITTMTELPFYSSLNSPPEGLIAKQQVKSTAHIQYCGVSRAATDDPAQCSSDLYLIETWAGPKWLVNPPIVEKIPEEAYSAEFTILEQLPYFDKPASADYNLPFTLDYVQPSKVQVTARKVLGEHRIWYKIHLPQGDKWIIPMGRTLDNVKQIQQTIELMTEAGLCDNPNMECFFSNEKVPAGSYPAVAQWNDWYYIQTDDRGMKWVNPAESLREKPLGTEPTSEKVQLLSTTTTYRTPDTAGIAGHLAGFFAPQYVDAFERWTSSSGELWYRVHTSETQEWVREQDVQVPLYPVVKDGKYGYMDQKGKLRIPMQYSSALDFKEGLALVWNPVVNGWSYIDMKGNEVIPARFNDAEPFSEGRAAVKITSGPKDTRQGYIDRDGKLIDMPDILYGSSFSEGMAAVAVEGMNSQGSAYLYGYMNKQGQMVIKPQFDFAYPFSWHMARVEYNGKAGFIQQDGSIAIPIEFDDARDFYQGTAAVKVGDRWGYLWSAGSWHIQPQYEEAGDFSEDLAAVRKDGKWGYINPEGTMVIPAIFDAAEAFSEGLAAVRVGDWQWGYIDTKGTVVIPPTYYDADKFHAGVANVRAGYTGEGPDSGYIDRTGKEIWKPSR